MVEIYPTVSKIWIHSVDYNFSVSSFFKRKTERYNKQNRWSEEKRGFTVIEADS